MLIGERLDTFSDKEKERINDSDKKSKMNALVMKYGRSRVRKVSDESEREVKRTGKKLSWEEFKKRLEKSKEKTRLRPGEVKKWDPERQKWVSNKDEEEEVNEQPNWNDGVNIRWNIGPNKKEVSLNLNGTTIASRKTEKWTSRTKAKTAVDKGLIDLKNTQDPAKNLPGMKN
tara:strand:- start:10 stop:528 length:519 start_codon:yes stop_codon:yes gene_type:complete